MRGPEYIRLLLLKKALLILVGLIISVIMYGNFKKGIKFSVPIVVVSYGIFYMISTFGASMLTGGF